jgi:hypothetical protein
MIHDAADQLVSFETGSFGDLESNAGGKLRESNRRCCGSGIIVSETRSSVVAPSAYSNVNKLPSAAWCSEKRPIS